MRHSNSTARVPLRRWGRFALAISTPLLAVAFGALETAGQDVPGKEGWIPLFNGKNLDGWKPKITGYALGENYADTFRVEDGILKVAYDKYPKFDGKFGHLFYKRRFRNTGCGSSIGSSATQCPGAPSWAFRNSGVMIHGQPPESMRKDQEFPVSIEVQFLGGNGKDKRPTGNVCTPGTNIVMRDKLITQHCTDSSPRPITATSGSRSRSRFMATASSSTSSTARP